MKILKTGFTCVAPEDMKPNKLYRGMGVYEELVFLKFVDLEGSSHIVGVDNDANWSTVDRHLNHKHKYQKLEPGTQLEI